MIENALKIQGWMSERELVWLAQRAKESFVIAEVGSYLGRSTMALADNCRGIVFSIDPYKGEYPDKNGNTLFHSDDNIYKQFCKNLNHYLDSKVFQKRMEFPQFFPFTNLDFIFIDGDHRAAALRKDIEHAFKLSKKGTIIAGHDYDRFDWPDVKLVVDELFPNANIEESIWWIQKF